MPEDGYKIYRVTYFYDNGRPMETLKVGAINEDKARDLGASIGVSRGGQGCRVEKW